ncbi:hypothetical protein CFP56_016295 [Quercus suber]|uniref:Uncharacterized protein n=1 Tax=Quercus suber TaxID=58331 RepID=A0AAW0KRT3_QUESU
MAWSVRNLSFCSYHMVNRLIDSTHFIGTSWQFVSRDERIKGFVSARYVLSVTTTINPCPSKPSDTAYGVFHLKLLDLSECNFLKQILAGLLLSLSHLEELYMYGVRLNWEPVEGNKEEEEEEENTILAELINVIAGRYRSRILWQNTATLQQDGTVTEFCGKMQQRYSRTNLPNSRMFIGRIFRSRIPEMQNVHRQNISQQNSQNAECSLAEYFVAKNFRRLSADPSADCS